MQVDEIRDEVLKIFGDTSEMQVNTDDIIRWLNDGQLQLVRRTECLLATDTQNTAAGDAEYALPVDFLKFHRVTLDGVLLYKGSSFELDQTNPNRDVGSEQSTPYKYYSKPGFIYLYPIPGSVQSLVVEYVQRPTLLTASNDEPDVPEEMQRDLIDFCLAKCYELDENWKQAQEKQKQFFEGSSMSRDDVKFPHDDTYPSVKDVW